MKNVTQGAAQTTGRVLMVRPHTFFSNPETASSNAFQIPEPEEATALAQGEFDAMVASLRDHGVDVIVVEDTATPETPDAVFPNNWISTHSDGTLITYPMQPMSRRLERRDDVVALLGDSHGLRVTRHVDLSVLEQDNEFLEGTGSLVLDHVQRRAYACYSPRTTQKALDRFCLEMDFAPVAFHATDRRGTPFYHTNVMMFVGSAVIVACVDAIAENDRERVVRALQADHELIPISQSQIDAFAGNMLECAGQGDKNLLVLSSRAQASLDDAQRARLSAHLDLLPMSIPTIETAGGSVRCMLAEIFLPEKGAAT